MSGNVKKAGKKKVAGSINIVIPAGKANPSPPVGTALGPRGINIMEFCKQFNAATQSEAVGTPIPVVIEYYVDKSFTFIMKKPPVSYYLKTAAKLSKGGSNPGKEANVAKITIAQARQIAQEKQQDMNAYDVEAALMSVKGSARSMGIEITE